MEHGPTLPRRAAIVIAIVLAAGCGAAPRRTGPAPATVATIERAETAEQARDHAAARAIYLDAIATAPDRASERFARHEYADTLQSWGEYPAMSAQLEAIVAIAPDDVAAWHDLGLVRHNLGDNAGAIAALTRARDLAPDDTRPRIALGALYWKTGQCAEALAEYRGLQPLAVNDRLRASVDWAIQQLTTRPCK